MVVELWDWVFMWVSVLIVGGIIIICIMRNFDGLIMICYYNILLLWKVGYGVVDYYDKKYLVLFGEYVFD